MNNSIYDEYMRSVLGYQPMNNNVYDIGYDNWEMSNMTAMNSIQMQELENCYPDIYRIVYPMVQRVCTQNTRSITRELIDSMTNEIYFAIEDKEILENRNKKDNTSQTTEDRKIRRDTNLNDLIRVLILRELLGRPGFTGGRPPLARPHRPPMRPPIGPPSRPQLRPGMGPFNRMTIGQYDDMYEY